MNFHRIKFFLSVIFVAIGFILLLFNIFFIKNFNRNKLELKETQLYNNVPNNIDKSNSFVETDYSRDFYRYKCKNRIRIGANRMYVDIIPDKLYRIEGTLYNEKSNINCIDL